MMADAISYTVLLGIVTAYLITRELSGISMLIGAIMALHCSLRRLQQRICGPIGCQS